MEKMPELIFSSSDRKTRAHIDKLRRMGKIRRIGPKLYTSASKDQEAQIVRANWSKILDQLYPGSLIAYRTAIEYQPDEKGQVYLISDTPKKDIKLPGLTFKFFKGPRVHKDDNDFLKTLKVSSFPRALLENLSPTQERVVSRAFPREQLEIKLEKILTEKGEDELNKIRDHAKLIATDLGLIDGFKNLDKLIGALLGTQTDKKLTAEEAIARSQGSPVDFECIARLEILISELRTMLPHAIGETYKGAMHFRNKAFFESYFSNYIEGTIFEIEEAEEIIFDKKIPEARPKDAHDIIGTFKIVSNPNEMRKIPKNEKSFFEILKSRHNLLMQQRPEALPGEFKKMPNRAGNTRFVHPDKVHGTLTRGFEYYMSIKEPYLRAIFIMFLINEVHPFTDGNGRVSRIMLNAELYAHNLSTIIIPNVFREDYISALRALSRRDRPGPLVRMLTRAQKFSNLDFANYSQILKKLVDRNWFQDSSEAMIIES